MKYKDLYEFLKENISDEEWQECSERKLDMLIRNYIRIGLYRKLFTQAKERIVTGLIAEHRLEDAKEPEYDVAPERWVMSIFDVDETISEKLKDDKRFLRKIEQSIVFDMTASIKDYLKYSAYGKAA